MTGVANRNPRQRQLPPSRPAVTLHQREHRPLTPHPTSCVASPARAHCHHGSSNANQCYPRPCSCRPFDGDAQSRGNWRPCHPYGRLRGHILWCKPGRVGEPSLPPPYSPPIRTSIATQEFAALSVSLCAFNLNHSAQLCFRCLLSAPSGVSYYSALSDYHP